MSKQAEANEPVTVEVTGMPISKGGSPAAPSVERWP